MAVWPNKAWLIIASCMALLVVPPLTGARLAPGLEPIGAAHADDGDDGDDGGDDGDDGDDDGGGGGYGGRAGDGDSRPIFRNGKPGDLFRFLRRPAPERERRPERRTTQRRAPAPITRRPNEIVAVGLEAEQIVALEAQGFAVRSRQELGTLGGEVVKLTPPGGQNLETARTAVRSLAPTAAIDFNHVYSPSSAPSCGGQPCVAPGLVGWPGKDALQASCSASNVTIGLIDTAISADHETFKNSRLEVLRLDPDAKDESGRQHGTAVASLLVGTGTSGTPGLLPQAQLIAVDAFRPDDQADAYDLIRAMDMLTARKVGVINLSLSGPDNAILAKAVAAVAGNGISMVAAAGNDGASAKPRYPAAYEQVISVTAVDRQKKIYRRAVQGEHIDLAAPGVGVWAAASISGARPKTGTSFAAPFVTAAVALARLQSTETSAINDMLSRQAEDLGEPGKDQVFGWGLLKADRLCPQIGEASEEASPAKG